MNGKLRKLTTLTQALWLTTALVLSLALTTGIDGLRWFGGVLGCAYTVALIVLLVRQAPHTASLPAFAPLVRKPRTYRWILVWVVGVASAAFMLMGVLLHNGWFMLMLSVVLAVVVLVRQRRAITRQMVGFGVGISVLIGLVEMLLGADLMMALLTLPLSVGGVLLLKHTRLTRCYSLERNWPQVARSFLQGCLLAVPPALLNIVMAQGAEEAVFDLQFTHWWQAFYALQPGLVEEVWARLFLTTLVYALLRPVSQKPRRALTAAVGISTFLHGLAHFPQSLADPVSAVLAALLYGVPLALLYVKRDFEHSVAYHFFIDFVRFLM